jgi:glycosyltransferase involved in cell wall biosynthesis
MKKILYVITKSNWGGAQRYVYDLATHLPKDKFEVGVALGGTGSKDATPGMLADKLRASGVRTLFVESFMRDISIFKEWRAFRELVHLFKSERPDIVHLNSSKAGGIGALAARVAGVKKIVFTSHGLAWKEDRNPLALLVIYFVSHITFLLCHKVITITKENYEVASSCLLCKSRVRMIHNGISEGVYLSKEEARQRLGLPTDAFIIGGIGELTWNKGWHYLVRASALLKHQGKVFTTAIIGAGEEKVFLQTIIEEENINELITFLGFIPEAAQYAKAFDIFVLPSIKEGLPYVLLEAGQAGLPVVASKIDGIPDIVGNKVSGLLVKPKNAHALAEGIATLIENVELRKQYGEVLKQRIKEEFSLSKMVKETEALY